MPNTSLNLTQEIFSISREQKELLNGHSAFVLWFTGFSASGKSTIARHLEEKLHKQGMRTIILDGDNTRLGINKDLDFTTSGRRENMRRVAEICSLMNSAGLITIASFISPLETDRLTARTIIGENSFIEVFIDAPLDLCIERDPKGLYKRALEGKISDFTGVNSAYEPPARPHIHLKTDEQTIPEAVDQIYSWLTKNKFISSDQKLQA
jgi:adenylyl-sulfate kinase